MEDAKYNFKAYVPTILLTNVLTSSTLFTTNDILKKRVNKFNDAYVEIRNHYGEYKNKVIREFAPNNWLKMHGYPMRRRKAKT